MKTLDEYIVFIGLKAKELSPDEYRAFLESELVERTRINIGLITENVALKGRIQQLEGGRADWVGPPPYGS